MRVVWILAATALASSYFGRVFAQTAAHKNPATVAGGTYVLEPSHTRVLFSIMRLGFTTWYGDMSHARGMLTFSPKDPAATKFDITLPISSIMTKDSMLDTELKSPRWFDAAQFPTAQFVSKSVTPTGAVGADVVGDLTLRGVTKPLTLHVKFNGAGINPTSKHYTVGVDARGVFRRSDFGMTKFVPLGSDDVDLIISAAFEHNAS